MYLRIMGPNTGSKARVGKAGSKDIWPQTARIYRSDNVLYRERYHPVRSAIAYLSQASALRCWCFRSIEDDNHSSARDCTHSCPVFCDLWYPTVSFEALHSFTKCLRLIIA